MARDPRRHAAGPRRSDAAHVAVLEAAQAVLAERGYQKTTMESIAKSAGVSKQTIYRWWKSKAAVFMEVYSTLARTHVKPRSSGNARADLKHLWKQLCRFYRKTAAGPALAGLLAEAQSDTAVAETFRGQFLKARREVTLSILRRGIESGELAPAVDVETVVDSIAGAVWYRLLVGNAPLSAKFVDSLVDQALDGISS